MSSEHPSTGSSNRRITLQQLEFIEFKLYWENEVCRQDLMEFFGISRPQASILFRRYDELAPGNLEYDLRSKRYVRSRSFKPKLVIPEPDAYFAHLLNSGRHRTDGLGSFSDASLRFRGWGGGQTRPSCRRSSKPCAAAMGSGSCISQ
jgi:hypothetical protein